MKTVPPGWYDDRHGGTRWWDGVQWTEQVALPRTADPTEAPSAVLGVTPDAARSAEALPSGPVPGGSPYWGGEPAAAQATAEIGYAAGDPVVREAPIPPPKPPRSQQWIAWAVLGAVVLGIVLWNVVGVPLFAGQEPTTVDSSDEIPSEVITEGPAPVLDLTADEQASVDAVERYNEAWLTGDCDAYFATTTEAYRQELDITDCDSFAASSDGFATSVDDFETTTHAVETSGSRILVHVAETYTSLYDEDGNMTERPVAYDDRWEYDMVSVEGAWAIYTVYLE